jgi:D-amino-acid dehydrogenase
MKIAILGGGVIGVTTAYQLALSGHAVTLFERRGGAALETSFANAGEVSPGYASPWAAPGIPAKAVRWLLMEHAPLIIRAQADPAMLRWLVALLRNCTAGRYRINKARMMRLAEYSRGQLEALRIATGIAYDERMQGTLQLFRTEKQCAGAAADIAVLADYGVAFEMLDAKGCIAAEPGLANARDPIAGGLRLPGDETGDCYKFTVALAALAANIGVDFRFDETIIGLERAGDAVTAVVTDRGRSAFDACVIALGSHSPALAHQVGLRLPVYPIKGYSLTCDIADPARAPVSTLLDESYKIAITRLGDRIRIGGMAEVAGYSDDLPERRRRTLEHSVTTLFPGAGVISGARYWSGLRPMTPDGTPIVGRTPLRNLFLNTGHGTLGWTMACGSARVLADIIDGRTPEIDTSDLGIERYGR